MLFYSDGSSLSGWNNQAASVEWVIDGHLVGSTVFSAGEAVIQPSTGASFTLINDPPGKPGVGPFNNQTYTGPICSATNPAGANATDSWVGQSSGAIFTPIALPISAFFGVGGSSYHQSIDGSYPNTPQGILTFKFMMQDTDHTDETWINIGFGMASGVGAPCLQINWNNTDGWSYPLRNSCFFQTQSLTTFVGATPVGGYTLPVITKSAWHTIKIVFGDDGNAFWYVDGVLQTGPVQLGEGVQGPYIGFQSVYGNTWITDISVSSTQSGFCSGSMMF